MLCIFLFFSLKPTQQFLIRILDFFICEHQIFYIFVRKKCFFYLLFSLYKFFPEYVGKRGRIVLIRQIIPPLPASYIVAEHSIGESGKPQISVEVLQNVISKHILQLRNPGKVIRGTIILQQTGRGAYPHVSRSGPANGKGVIGDHGILTLTLGIMFHPPGPKIHPVQTTGKRTYPQIIPIQTKAMNILINGRMFKGHYLSVFRIVIEQAFVFGTYPQSAVITFTDFPYTTAKMPEIVSRIELLEISPLIRIIVHSTEIGTYPHAVLLVTAERINGFVRQCIRIILVGNGQMGNLAPALQLHPKAKIPR